MYCLYNIFSADWMLKYAAECWMYYLCTIFSVNWMLTHATDSNYNFIVEIWQFNYEAIRCAGQSYIRDKQRLINSYDGYHKGNNIFYHKWNVLFIWYTSADWKLTQATDYNYTVVEWKLNYEAIRCEGRSYPRLTER